MRVGLGPVVIIQSSELNPAQEPDLEVFCRSTLPDRCAAAPASRGWLCKIGVPLEEMFTGQIDTQRSTDVPGPHRARPTVTLPQHGYPFHTKGAYEDRDKLSCAEGLR